MVTYIITIKYNKQYYNKVKEFNTIDKLEQYLQQYTLDNSKGKFIGYDILK